MTSFINKVDYKTTHPGSNTKNPHSWCISIQ